MPACVPPPRPQPPRPRPPPRDACARPMARFRCVAASLPAEFPPLPHAHFLKAVKWSPDGAPLCRRNEPQERFFLKKKKTENNSGKAIKEVCQKVL